VLSAVPCLVAALLSHAIVIRGVMLLLPLYTFCCIFNITYVHAFQQFCISINWSLKLFTDTVDFDSNA